MKTSYEAHKEISDTEENAISKIAKREREAASLAEKLAAGAAILYHQIEVNKTWAEFYNVACVSKETIAAEIEDRKASDMCGFFGEATEEAVIEFFKKQREHYKLQADERKIQFDTLKKYVDEDAAAKNFYNELLYHDAEYWSSIHSMN